MDEDDDRRRDRIVSEELLGKVGATFELVGQVARDMPEIKERLGRVETRLGTVEAIVREHSLDLKEIKRLVGGQQEAIAELRAASHEP